jgi:cyclic 2,3-diphosphoglycerate synthase
VSFSSAFPPGSVVVVTFADHPSGRVDVLLDDLRRLFDRLPRIPPRQAEPEIVATTFRPEPLGDIRGKRVLFATTAPDPMLQTLVDHLEEVHGARVVAATNRLAHRPALRTGLAAAPDYDVVLTELKAAAVDVAVAAARERGAEAVFCDNRPLNLAGGAGLGPALTRLVALADERAAGSPPQ